ncbi:MAG: UbiA family prenyltransferase [Candidatus Limnocylindrales bacterium]
MTTLASLAGLVRLVHPFPSLLCAVATAAIAALAGAPPQVVVRLGVAMLGIQVSIGALNDLVDAPLDAVQKPRKPIPSGLVTRRSAGIVTAAGAGIGIGLSAVSDPATAIAGVACLALGYAYDLRLSRTKLSWLPLSLALPLLPIHAWLGAAGTIPSGLLTLIPVGVLGGAGLALANGLADVERDARAGRRAIAVALGARWAWVLQTLALAAAAMLAVLLAPAVPAAAVGSIAIDMEILRTLRGGGIWLGIALIAGGAAVLASGAASVRERGWELEAIGVACLGVGWLAGTAAAVQ